MMLKWGFSTDAPTSPTVPWYMLQALLEHCESDVLILLDCCAAASSATASGNGVTEVIAACGFETWAPAVGEHSLSRTLIDELDYWSCERPSLSAAMLHSKVLSRIKCWKPRYEMSGQRGKREPPERRKTPIYIRLSDEGKKRSIELKPLPLLPLAELPTGIEDDPAHSSQCDDITMSSIEDAEEIVPECNQYSLGRPWPDPANQCPPKVLISLALEDDQWLKTDDWAEWLKEVPAIVKYAEVQGIYKSHSILMLLSLPVAAWDLLPKDPAVTFVAFILSDNLRKCECSRRDLTEEVKTDNARAEEANAEEIGAYKVKPEIIAHHTPFAKSRQADGLQSERTVITESRDRDFDIIAGARIIKPAAGTSGGKTAPDRAKSLQNWGWAEHGSGKGEIWDCCSCNSFNTARFSVQCSNCNHLKCGLCM